jgi:transcriptional regulator with GAF, ATPase, and Fis domain
VDPAEAAINGQCDFKALLTQVLARFANCPHDHVDREIGRGFRTVCEFLEADRAAMWTRSGKDAESFVLTHAYPARLVPSPDGGPGRTTCLGQSLIAVGCESKALFPWLTAQVKFGRPLFFSDPNQLPAEAAQDRQTLSLLGLESFGIFPFTVGSKVAGALSFMQDHAGAGWPAGLVQRLSLIVQVFANAACRSAVVVEQKSLEEELAKSCAEIKQLRNRLQAESQHLKAEVKLTQRHGEILGHSQGIKRVLQQVEQVAPTDCAVLITGETGTGKELIAQEIHRLSRRSDHRMVLVNCAALPSALVESELFGRERGAYTGALSSQVGRFEVADGSTIFLDEVGELSPEVQSKLLRVLQQGEFQRLGSPKTHKVNVRVLAATNRDLTAGVRNGEFREDLYYRLRVFPIDLPPLRARVEDIPLLVFAFMEEFSTRMGKKITKVPRSAMEKLQRHPWLGNIRELRNIIEHSVILTSGDVLKLSSLGDAPTRETRAVTLADAEREHILKVLENTGWRIKGPHGAAIRLDVQPSTLYSRMQKLGIPHRRQKEMIG